jgi:hypothetical protein
VPAVIAAISTAKSALRKLSAAPYEISAAHWANSASANARLRTAEPTGAAAEAHTPSRAADVHTSRAADVHAAATAADVHAAATAGHATSAATATANVHATTTAAAAAAVHAASRAAAPLLGEHRGCNC